METIGAIDDTIEAEDGDPGYNEPVVFNVFNQTDQLVQAANDWRFSSNKTGTESTLAARSRG